MIFTQFQKIMKNEEAEAKVVAYKIARDLDGTSPVVGPKALMMFLVVLVCNSKNPKRTADFIIEGLKRAVGGTNDDHNLVDLSKVWRDASEEPEDDFAQILYQDKIGTYRITVKHDIVMLMDNWENFAADKITRWAYAYELSPKGGKNDSD